MTPENLEPVGAAPATAPEPGNAVPDGPALPDALVEAATQDRVIDTSSGKRDGLDKCPRCGATEIGYSMRTHSLLCEFCRHQWNEDVADTKFGFDSDISALRGQVTGSGAGEITDDETVVTLKCQGCGAEVVVATDSSLQARCHWCRQILSISTQIANGAVPDALLPFTVTHAEAVAQVSQFVSKRKLFALPRFRREFVPENVVGVYMPYMIVDGNVSAEVVGTGEIETRRYTVTVGSGDRKRQETRYDADVYQVGRKFDMAVDDLVTESSESRSDMNTRRSTNNVLNAVMPFDVKNAVAYNANYLGAFTSERRDLDISDMEPRVHGKFLSIARAKATDAARQYDRGIRWEGEAVDVHGTRWVAVYLPVWLYSYYTKKKDGSDFVHYIAVNGRTKETMGSVPVSHPRLALAAGVASIATFVATAIGFWG